MSVDILAKVLTAATQRRIIYGGNPETSFELIVHRDLTPKDAKKVRRIQAYVLETYGVDMSVVGGGSGCTRLTFECESLQKLLAVLHAIAIDPTLKQLIQECGADFKIGTPLSPFSYDGADAAALLAAIEGHQKSAKAEPLILHLSDLVSKSEKLPSRETLLEVVVNLRRELKKVALPDFKEINKLRQDADVICRAWENDDVTISRIAARLARLERFKKCCGDYYPTAVGIAGNLCDILKTIRRAARHYANV